MHEHVNIARKIEAFSPLNYFMVLLPTDSYTLTTKDLGYFTRENTVVAVFDLLVKLKCSIPKSRREKKFVAYRMYVFNWFRITSNLIKLFFKQTFMI